MVLPLFSNRKHAEKEDNHQSFAYNHQKFEKMQEAIQEFVDRVEKGEISSKYHYRKFKDLLSD